MTPMVTIQNEDGNVSLGINTAMMEGLDNEDMKDDELVNGDFSIATHFVKVRRTGALSDVTTLWELVGTDAVSGSLDSILDRPGFSRLPSINAFDKVGVVLIYTQPR